MDWGVQNSGSKVLARDAAATGGPVAAIAIRRKEKRVLARVASLHARVVRGLPLLQARGRLRWPCDRARRRPPVPPLHGGLAWRLRCDRSPQVLRRAGGRPRAAEC